MQPCKVIIFGGTTEGRELARILADRGALVTVSVATELGEEMLRDISAEEEPGHFRTLVGRLNVEEMQGIIREFDICYDATHPYAVEVTANLREACGKTGTRYIRVIRKEAESSELDQGQEGVRKSDSVIDSHAECGRCLRISSWDQGEYFPYDRFKGTWRFCRSSPREAVCQSSADPGLHRCMRGSRHSASQHHCDVRTVLTADERGYAGTIPHILPCDEGSRKERGL